MFDASTSYAALDKHYSIETMNPASAKIIENTIRSIEVAREEIIL